MYLSDRNQHFSSHFKRGSPDAMKDQHIFPGVEAFQLIDHNLPNTLSSSTVFKSDIAPSVTSDLP